jgi:hypothetical protein
MRVYRCGCGHDLLTAFRRSPFLFFCGFFDISGRPEVIYVMFVRRGIQSVVAARGVVCITPYMKNGKAGRMCHEYRNDGKSHCEDGTLEYFLNGERYREDGTREWYLNGKFHRGDGPAVIREDGTLEYFLNGKRHRKDGPAIIYPNGALEYWLNGKLHHEDGPAVVRVDGTVEYWVDDISYEFE